MGEDDDEILLVNIREVKHATEKYCVGLHILFFLYILITAC
jgi:hypothetical protein